MIKKLKIRGRLRFGYILLLVIILIITILSLTGLKYANINLNNFVDGALAADSASKMCRIYTNTSAKTIRELVLLNDPSAIDTYTAKIAEEAALIDEELQKLKTANTIDNSLYTEYEDAIKSWEQISENIIAEMRAGNTEAATTMVFKECTPALQKVLDIGQKISATTNEIQTDILNNNIKTTNSISVIILILLILSVIFGYLFAKKIILSIITPLKDIEHVALEMSKGILQTELTNLPDDEIGSVGHSLVNSMQTLSSYIKDIDRGMSSMADGNFLIKPSQTFIGDFESIEHSITTFVAKMSDTLHSMQEISELVTDGSTQVSSSSQEVAQSSTEQAGVIEELTANIESITSKITANAEKANEINAQVITVGNEIAVGNTQMQDLLIAMKEINETSEEISNIIDTINSIATQTNLLALNASIEAARVGDAGLGFAVVANQVGKLASESAIAAKNSSDLINASLDAVKHGMNLTAETAEKIEGVVEGAKEIQVKVAEIASASTEQAYAAEQINLGVEQIAGRVQVNAASSQESAATSEELSAQAMTLQELISQFQV